MFTELKKRFAADPFEKFSIVLAELQKLNHNLKFINGQADSLEAIVNFFEKVSPWHDRGLTDVIEAFTAANYKHRYDLIIGDLTTLNNHFVSAGRDRYGWNRTEKGEAVTDGKVYLGNIYGLSTLPVSYWRGQQNEPKNAWRDTIWQDALQGMNSYDVVSRQARQFIDSHIELTMKLIDELEIAAGDLRAA